MKFLRKVLFTVLMPTISANASDFCLKWGGDRLKPQTEVSFCIDEGHYWQIWTEDALYKDGSKNIELAYRNYGKEHGIDILTSRGNNF